MGLIVDGVPLSNVAYNVRTIGERLTVGGRSGENMAVGGLDGTLWQPDKPLAELAFDVSMWIGGNRAADVGAAGGKEALRARYDQLVGLLVTGRRLREVVDDDSGRRCYAEFAGGFTPTTMMGGQRAEVTFPAVVPAGCWEDLAEFDSGSVVLGANTVVPVPGSGGGTAGIGELTVTVTPPARNVVATIGELWVAFDGDLPAGAPLVMTVTPGAPDVRQDGSPTSLIGSFRMLDAMGFSQEAAADVSATVTAEATSAASRVQVTGRRRWLSA